MNDTEQPMTPNLLHLPPYLQATCQPEKLAPGRPGKLTVTLLSDKISSYGLTQAPVFLASQLGQKVAAGIEVPVSVVLLPDTSIFSGQQKELAPHIAISAEQLTLGRVNGHNVKSGSIAISNTGQSELNIRSMQLFTGGMKVTLGKRTLRPGESTRLRVSVDRAELLRQRTRPRVLMITNDPQCAKVIVNINVK